MVQLAAREVLHTSFPVWYGAALDQKRTPTLASGTQDVSEPRWSLTERERVWYGTALS